MNGASIKKDRFVPLAEERIAYKGMVEKVNQFVQKEQLLDEWLWDTFVYQFSFNADDCDGGWRGEYWGKMMRGACLTYQYTHSKKLLALLKKSVKNMLDQQDKLGRFSTYSIEKEFRGWDLWGRKYAMLGMLYFLDICDNKELSRKVIKALKKHADYIVQYVGNGKKNIAECSSALEGVNSCSILEPFVKLYRYTQKEEYLHFAEHIISVGFTQSQNLIELALKKEKYPFQFNISKAYEMMSCFQGLLEYYKITGKEEHLTAVKNFFDLVAESELTEIGALGCNYEYFNHSVEKQTEYFEGPMLETCVTVTWMNCCYQLLAFTGDIKYADWIEQSAVNAMFGAVNIQKNKQLNKWIYQKVMPWETKGVFFPFDSYSPLVKNRRAIDIGGKKPITPDEKVYGCCTCISSAGTAISALYGVMKFEKGYVFNSFDKAIYRLKTASGKDFSVKVNGDAFTGNGKIQFRFFMQEKEKLQIKLRIPAWSKKTSVFINGEEVENVSSGSYLDISQTFENSTVIEIWLDNRFVVEKRNGKMLVKKGAYVLARDERYNDNIDEDYQPKITKTGNIKAKKICTGLFDCLGEYEIETKQGKIIKMCDYASAGKIWDDLEERRITAWL